MDASSPIGSEIAGYRVERLIGRGGMGVVYLAVHVRLGRRSALKILLPDLAEDERFRERFIRESRLAASLDHPNIVPVYDAGEVDGTAYIAMRYVDGVDLGGLIASEGRLDPDRAVSIIGQIADALDAAHGEGLVHRDIKPGNILIEPRGEGRGVDHAYLTDFGLTKHAHSNSGLTRTGQFIGTIDFVAPEQIEGKEIDGRADLYSLACVLFQCLTGSAPFPKESEVAIMYAHLRDEPPSARALRPDLPEGVDAVLARGMAKDPDERFSTCAQMMAAMRAALGGHAVPEAAVTQEAARPDAPETKASPVPTQTPDDVAQGVEPPAGPPKRASKALLLTVALSAIVLVVFVVVLTTIGESPTDPDQRRPSSSSRAPGSPTPGSTPSGQMISFFIAVDGTLAKSEQARATVNAALADAASSTRSRRERAPGGLQTAIAQREQQVEILRKLDPPAGTEKATGVLIRALLEAIASDRLYLRSVQASLAGDATEAQSLMASAQANDAQEVHHLKKSFVRQYNDLRREADLPPIPSPPTF